MQYHYGFGGQIIAAYDPRISPNLIESYEYGGPFNWVMTTLTPPGQLPWSFGYYDVDSTKRLKTVSRPSLVSSPTVAKTTVVYDVPITGPNAPADRARLSVKDWGQRDYPVNATAIFRLPRSRASQ